MTRDELHAKVKKLWAEGATCVAIGDELGVTKGVITGIAFRLKLPIRPRPYRPTLVARGDLVASRKPTVALMKPSAREIQAMHPVNDNSLGRKAVQKPGRIVGAAGSVEHPRQATSGARVQAFRVEKRHDANVAFPLDKIMPKQAVHDTKIAETPPLPAFKPRASKHECQFPTTYGNRHRMECTVPAINGPYCVEHKAICWVPTRAQTAALT